MSELWEHNDSTFLHKAGILYLGSDSQPNTPKIANSRRTAGGSSSNSSSKVPATLIRATQVFHRPASGDSTAELPLFYFEMYVKTSGGGLQPSGSVGVGLADVSAELCQLDGTPSLQMRFLHLHSSGRRFENFPRSAALRSSARVLCQPFASGDTVGCGWLANGNVFPRRLPRGR